ncbi:MAG TPA: hypothetical protein VKB86_06465 [Pyrinomonadaceae bacterium]|nr:hypothetical protein [Pyrinomonadaceae bacterium]
MAKASYEVNTLALKVGPIHERLLAYFNDMHEARAAGDTETIAKLEMIVPQLLDEFEATECRNSPNPGWMIGKMRGGWNLARGELYAALQAELSGFRYADEEPSVPGVDDTDKKHRKSVSASNIADQLWRMGRAAEGLPWAQLSVELWPSNSVNYLVLAITAYHAGFKKQADQIFRNLREAANFKDNQDVIAKCMEFERELYTMTDLPAVSALLKDMGVRQ